MPYFLPGDKIAARMNREDKAAFKNTVFTSLFGFFENNISDIDHLPTGCSASRINPKMMSSTEADVAFGIVRLIHEQTLVKHWRNHRDYFLSSRQSKSSSCGKLENVRQEK